MTIKNYTFFSPNGTEFPVGSNNDGKMYMMLTGMDYGTIRRKDWANPVNTALNIQYVNTSIVAGGRYFELVNHPVSLQPNITNYIHANIDLTQVNAPVSISAEAVDNSNQVDLNNDSGVFKVVIDMVATDGQGVVGTETPKQVTTLDEVVANRATFGLTTVDSLENKSDIDWTSAGQTNSYWKKEGKTVTFRWDMTKNGGNGNMTLGQIPAEYAPPQSLMIQAPAFSGASTNDRHLQFNGTGGGAGLATILNAVNGAIYRGQIKYDI